MLGHFYAFLPFVDFFILTRKMHLKMWSAEVVCCKKLHILLTNLSIEANRMDPDPTAPIWVHTVFFVWPDLSSQLFAKVIIRQQKLPPVRKE